VFTALYALSPYIKQIRFVFKGLISSTKRCNTLNGPPPPGPERYLWQPFKEQLRGHPEREQSNHISSKPS
jgi:hypothetical protein